MRMTEKCCHNNNSDGSLTSRRTDGGKNETTTAIKPTTKRFLHVGAQGHSSWLDIHGKENFDNSTYVLRPNTINNIDRMT